MKKSTNRFMKCERRGQSLIEYALVLALVSVICTGILSRTGSQLTTLFTTVSTKVNSATSSGQ
jgi:Flp pilus assembly pilin Flp